MTGTASPLQKIVCVVRDPHPPALEPPGAEGVAGYAAYLPADHAEHPPGVLGVAMVWVEPDSPIDVARWFPRSTIDAYLVDERVPVDYERDWPDGTVSPGLHRIVFVRRAATLTRAEMARHWTLRHGPLVPVHHPGFWCYAQNVVIRPVTPGTPDDVDGIAEMHFRSAAEMRDRFYASDDSKRIIAEDVARFLDREAGWRILGEEHWVLTPRTRSAPGR